MFLDAPPLPKAKASKARPKLVLSALQPVERDFAFLVDAGVDADKLVRAARNADKALITGARVFDLYAGKGVPEGKKSLAVAVTLQPVERTLTDAEIEARVDQDRGAGRESDRRCTAWLFFRTARFRRAHEARRMRAVQKSMK